MPPPAEPLLVPVRAVGVCAVSRPARADGAEVGQPEWLTLAGAYRANGGRSDAIDRVQAASNGGRRD